MTTNLSPKETNDLGDKYFYGKGVPQNIELAYTYYKQTADEGNPVGLYNVGRYFIEKQEYKQALSYLQKSLASGYSKAHLVLADMALKGKGMLKSKKKAFRYTMEGAKLQDTDAYNQLAGYYLKGIGCEKDIRKAREYYQKSADLKNPEGMYRLALMMLETGKGQKNPEEAMKWLDEAVEANHKEAIDAIYSLYEKPHPYFKKRSQAFRKEMMFYYLEKKARIGDEKALEKVAQDYLEGTMITPENPEKAACGHGSAS